MPSRGAGHVPFGAYGRKSAPALGVWPFPGWAARLRLSRRRDRGAERGWTLHLLSNEILEVGVQGGAISGVGRVGFVRLAPPARAIEVYASARAAPAGDTSRRRPRERSISTRELYRAGDPPGNSDDRFRPFVTASPRHVAREASEPRARSLCLAPELPRGEETTRLRQASAPGKETDRAPARVHPLHCYRAMATQA